MAIVVTIVKKQRTTRDLFLLASQYSYSIYLDCDEGLHPESRIVRDYPTPGSFPVPYVPLNTCSRSKFKILPCALHKKRKLWLKNIRHRPAPIWVLVYLLLYPSVSAPNPCVLKQVRCILFCTASASINNQGPQL